MKPDGGAKNINKPSLVLEMYNVRLSRVVPADLELIRRKRNAANGKNIYVEETRISKKHQKEWYKRIDQPDQYYFIIWQDRRKVGMIHDKNMSADLATGEGGIYIWDERFAATQIGILASVILYEFFFGMAGQKVCTGKTLLVNKVRVSSNRLLGYEIKDTVEQGKYVLQQLSKDRYFSYTRTKLAKLLQIYGDKPLKISGYVTATQHARINNLLRKDIKE